MEIKRLSQEELLVIITTNPDAAETQDWVQNVASELTGNEKKVTVTLKDLVILSSLGVNVIVGMYQKMKQQGGGIEVEVPNEQILRVFELFKLTSIFPVRIATPE